MLLINKFYELRVVTIVTILSLISSNCKSQYTFSNRYEYGYSTLFKMVMSTDYGYLVIGEARDTTGEYFTPMLAVAYDEQGEVISTKAYGSSDQSFVFDTAHDTDVKLNDSTFVIITSYNEQNNDTNYVAALWLTEFGDTLQTRMYTSPYYIEGALYTDTNIPTSIAVSEDGQNLYYSSQIFHSSSQNNFLIKKLTAQGDEVWTYINPLNIWYAYCNSLFYFGDKLWFVAMSSGNEDHYNKLKSLNDETGVVDFEIEHQGEGYPIGGSNDILLDESGVVISTTKSINGLLPHVFKMNMNGEYQWYNYPPESPAPFQYNEHMVRSPDGGYVSCSVKYDEQINPEDPNDPSSNNTSEKIWLWKVDGNGDFLWQRFYEYLSFDSGYFYLNNTANDLKATPDGGYIMAGEATAGCLDWPCLSGDPFTQQGWLLKVDGCGCLVPGCDETCVVGVSENASGEVPTEYFKMGPNPVSDVLHVYLLPIPTLQHENISLQVHDMQGVLIKTLNFKSDNTTYIIDASSLPAGQYVLSLLHEGNVLQTELMVVGR